MNDDTKLRDDLREQINKLAEAAGKRAAVHAVLQDGTTQQANEVELRTREEVSARLTERSNETGKLPPDLDLLQAAELPIIEDGGRVAPPVIHVTGWSKHGTETSRTDSARAHTSNTPKCGLGRLVALTGPAGSGKTTIAKALEQRGFVRVRFAGPLKAMLRAAGLTEAQVDGNEKEVPLPLLCGKTSRFAQQELGTGWGRDRIGADVWVNMAMKQVDELLAAGRDVVVDDLRFNNEAEALAARGALMFGLLRNGAGTTHVHASEAGIATSWLTDWLDNNGSVEETLAQLNSYLEVSRANRQ